MTQSIRTTFFSRGTMVAAADREGARRATLTNTIGWWEAVLATRRHERLLHRL